MIRIWIVICGISCFSKGYAQHQELHETNATYKGNHTTEIDTTSLLAAFKKGNFNGHFRYFFMSTDNKNLSDYYANAVGGGLRYETAKFHGFRLAVSGFYIFNIGSSDFEKLDVTTNQSNRYEIALFDVKDPRNKKDIDRLEELYLNYKRKNISITLGRQLINTPFINLQDGRMRPTGVEGFWSEYKSQNNKTNIEGGILYGVSPRGTVKWFNIGESIGIFSNGLNIDGSKANYYQNIESNVIGLIGLEYQMSQRFKIHVWEMVTHNVFNTAMVQLDYDHTLSVGSKIFSSFQVTKQHSLHSGGNDNPSKTYFAKNKTSLAISARLGFKKNKWEHSINYTRITDEGRYLMPREWGRDHFFTFMPRERNEGLGDVHAFVFKNAYQFSDKKSSLAMGLGYFRLPSVENAALNKYGLPSYTQFNADFKYQFGGAFSGFDVQLLVASKLKIGNSTLHNYKYQLNRVDMVNYNVVINFHF